MVRRFLAIAWTLGAATSASALPFVLPIGGTPYVDWTIVNYVDLDPGPGVLDFNGGPYSYNGHDAIDFTLANFAAMDAGISVNAAAAGTVTSVHDGEFDRWSRVNPNPGQPGNHVIIDHGGGLETRYWHFKKDSITVNVGDTVTAGQFLGEVGSSGNSSDAHLHFAVYGAGNAIETYSSPSTFWIDPLPYAGDVAGSLDFGTTDHFPTTAELVERPQEVDVFFQTDGPGQTVGFWTHLFGIQPGDALDFYIYSPDGTEYQHQGFVTQQLIRYNWGVLPVTLPNVPDAGQWDIVMLRNGAPFVEESFLVAVPEPAAVTLAGIMLLGLALQRRRPTSRQSVTVRPDA